LRPYINRVSLVFTSRLY